MRKKLLCMLLISGMLMTGFTGCSNEKKDQTQSAQSTVENSIESNTESDADSKGSAEDSGQSVDNGQNSTDSQSDAGSQTGSSQTTADNSQDNAGQTEEEEAPILKKAVQDVMGCRVGCAATGNEFNDEKVWEIITTHFNAITLGNELKPDALFLYSNGRCPGTEEAELNGETIVVPKISYNFSEKALDKIYDWNQANPDNRIMVRGHVLVWHSQTPEWFFHVDYDKNKDYVDKATMDKRLEWYIRTVLTHFTGEDSKYKDMFYGWDVVNEAVSDGSGTYRSDNENPNESLSNDTHGSNSSWWHVYQSNEYVINAFKYANKYAPASLELYYNDYNDCYSPKIQAIKQLLRDVKEQEGEPGVGTRISAFGMQGHYNMSDPEMTKFSNCVADYADIVGHVQITEWDISASDDYDGTPESKEKEYKNQKKRYAALYLALKNANKKYPDRVTGITFWGTADHYSWLQNRSDVGGGSSTTRPQCPLLFDENYEAKPAFYAFTN